MKRLLALLLALLAVETAGAPLCADEAAEELLAKAAQAEQSRHYDAAVEHASAALAQDTKNAPALAMRARLYMRLGRPAAAIADLDRYLEINPKKLGIPSIYELRGTEKFKLGRFEEAIADFDREIERDPPREPWHWKRGLAYYYAGQYEKGQKQFERYHDLEDGDVENAIWRFLCMVQSGDVQTARSKMLKVRDDPRVGMMEAYRLFRGEATPDDVLGAIQRGQPEGEALTARRFYAHLYLGLHFDVLGQRERAAEHLQVAVDNRIDHFMWDIAKLHLQLVRDKRTPAAKSPLQPMPAADAKAP